MKFIQIIVIIILFTACNQPKSTYTSLEDYPIPATDLWINYSKESTAFKLWSPSADEVKINLYEKGDGENFIDSYSLDWREDGVWNKKIEDDLNGVYYTFQVKHNDEWLDETPGIYAQAVGVNGRRAMILDMDETNPDDWENDNGPEINYTNEAIIYELHIRDITIHSSSGSSKPGKYLGLVEEGTVGPNGIATGIDHMKELGITHVHLLPTYDHYAIDETKLDSPQFNWGYDPQNYNVPEGSFSEDPYNAEVRIKEFKQMVKAFHDNGIGVILDVVYNHTGRTENSNFNLENPGYYYRTWEDGRLSDASACGNETASDREMMRKYIVESVSHWAREYHLDGFRFDLMGIHDVETMNAVTDALQEINPEIFVYGEGWTAGDSPLPTEDRALKAHTQRMPKVSAFSDDIRDGLKGSVFEESSTGFVSGAEGMEESVKFGVVGSILHPEIDYKAVNYSNEPWANHPWQAISYVSCHDNHTIYDKLKVSRPDADEATIIAMNKLANAVVLTSQGTPFLHAGAELLRTKDGEHNSYNLPDEINQIDWNWKVDNAAVLDYYKNLIRLRKKHPAFWMSTSEEVNQNLSFKQAKDGLVSYEISGNANGDRWKKIHVIYNAGTSPIDYALDEDWNMAVLGDNFEGSATVSGSLKVPAISMAVLYQE